MGIQQLSYGLAIKNLYALHMQGDTTILLTDDGPWHLVTEVTIINSSEHGMPTGLRFAAHDRGLDLSWDVSILKDENPRVIDYIKLDRFVVSLPSITRGLVAAQLKGMLEEMNPRLWSMRTCVHEIEQSVRQLEKLIVIPLLPERDPETDSFLKDLVLKNAKLDKFMRIGNRILLETYPDLFDLSNYRFVKHNSTIEPYVLDLKTTISMEYEIGHLDADVVEEICADEWREVVYQIAQEIRACKNGATLVPLVPLECIGFKCDPLTFEPSLSFRSTFAVCKIPFDDSSQEPSYW